MTTRKLFTILVCLFGLSQLVYAETLEETFKKNLSAEGKVLLDLSNSNGSVQITGWEKNEIDIIAYKRVRSSDLDRAEECMEKLEIEINESKDRVIIKTLYPRNDKNSGFISWMFDGHDCNCSVTYEIRVPHKLNLDITSTNGNIQVAECEGQSKLSTTNGKIEAENMKGTLDLKSTNGSIRAELNAVPEPGEMEMRTTNGSIRLGLPGNINADLEAHTTNGSINCDIPLSEKYHKSRRTLEAAINDGGPLIYLKTTNGSIHVFEI